VDISYISLLFGISCQEKSGNPASNFWFFGIKMSVPAFENFDAIKAIKSDNISFTNLPFKKKKLYTYVHIF
jgi:GTP-dependent phosphoenolpyruvate carboxykinase